MATSVQIGFDAEQELIDGKGWVLTYRNSDNVTITSTHSTWSNITGVAQDVFSDDPDIDAFFLQRAIDDLVAANATTIATSKATKRTADGLDATP